MFHVVPVDQAELGGKPWLWLERPCGEVYLLVDRDTEVRMPAPVAGSLAQAFLSSPARAVAG